MSEEEEGGKGLWDRTKEIAHEAKELAEDTVKKGIGEAKELAERVEDGAEDIADKVKDRAGRLADGASERLDDVADKLRGEDAADDD